MKNLIYCFGVIALFSACDKSSQNNQNVTTTIGSEEHRDFSGIYAYEQNGDTVMLHLTVINDKATGNLLYALKEKDRNWGTFQGKVENDVLLADYTFNSEGTLSERQIAFKLNPTTAVEGYGDIEEKEGKVVFKNATQLQYGTGLVLTKK